MTIRAKRPPLHVALVRAPLISRLGAFNNEAVPHLGLAYLAGYVRHHGYEVEIVDGIAEGLNAVHRLERWPGYQIQGIPLEELAARIPARSDVIGFTCMFSAEWVLLRTLIELVRRRFPSALLVGGGEHMTALPEYSLRDCPALDVIVKGEGEQIFHELLEAHAAGDVSNVDGICFLDAGGAFRDNGGLPRIRKPETIPRPWWPDGYLEKFWSAGKSYGVRTQRDMPILATRGCPYQCTFCSSPQMWSTRYVMRDVDDVVDEIKHYIGKYDITSFQLYDLTAFVKRDFTIRLCERLKQEGIRLRWSLPSGTRSEALDADVLRLLRETGCDYLAYAPESGSPETLKKIKKRVNLDRMVRSIEAARDAGLVLRTNLIIGFPHETRRDILKTLLFGLRMAIKGVDEVPYYMFTSYPGTEIFRELCAQGRITLDDDYFMSLVSFNGEFANFRIQGLANPNVSGAELAAMRLIFMLLNYGVGYLLRPHRILRTLRNTLRGDESATVFENRLQDALHRRRIRPGPAWPQPNDKNATP